MCECRESINETKESFDWLIKISESSSESQDKDSCKSEPFDYYRSMCVGETTRREIERELHEKLLNVFLFDFQKSDL